MASADPSLPIPPPYDSSSTRQVTRYPRVRRATFIPYARRIYFLIFRVAIGLRILWPPRPDEAASYALRIPRAGTLPTPSSRPHLAMAALGVSAHGSRHQGPQGTFTPKCMRPAGRNRVGGGLTTPASHTTVRAVRHTAVHESLLKLRSIHGNLQGPVDPGRHGAVSPRVNHRLRSGCILYRCGCLTLPTRLKRGSAPRLPGGLGYLNLPVCVSFIRQGVGPSALPCSGLRCLHTSYYALC